MVTLIRYNPDLTIQNVDQLPRGLGAPYLEVVEHRPGVYIAKRWLWKLPKTGVVVTFTNPRGRK